jgi:hypothetical protein
MDTNPNGTMDNLVVQEVDVASSGNLPDQETTTKGEPNLPENAAERTRKEFEKLLASNKELKAKLKELEVKKQAEVKTEVSNYSSNISEDMGDYVDEEGNVLIDKLNQDLKSLKMSALEAKALAEDAKNTIEVEKAVTKHPYLDPANTDYDPQFVELVKDRLARLQLEGKNASLSMAADEVLRVYKPMNATLKEREDAVSEYKKTQVAKAQVGSVNSGRNIRVDQSIEDLKQKLYSFNSNDRSFAIQERLKKIGL